MPAWKKGQTGNAGGRPKKSPELRAFLESHNVEAAQVLLDVMKSKGAEPKDRIAAAKVFIEWTLPKPAAESGAEGEKRVLDAFVELMRAKGSGQ